MIHENYAFLMFSFLGTINLGLFTWIIIRDSTFFYFILLVFIKCKKAFLLSKPSEKQYWTHRRWQRGELSAVCYWRKLSAEDEECWTKSQIWGYIPDAVIKITANRIRSYAFATDFLLVGVVCKMKSQNQNNKSTTWWSRERLTNFEIWIN